MVETIVEARGGELFQGGNASTHRQWITGKRAGLVNGAERRDVVHQFGTAPVSRNGHATANNFAKSGEVAFHAEKLLGRAIVQAEAGDDFIDDQKRAVSAANFTQTLQKAVRWSDNAHVRGDGLYNNGGVFILVLLEDAFHGGQIVFRLVE